MVCSGEVDASAIDSQVLAVAMRDDPSLSKRLRVIDSLGPSTIQPVVAATRLPDSLKADIREVLLTMSRDSAVRTRLATQPTLFRNFENRDRGSTMLRIREKVREPDRFLRAMKLEGSSLDGVTNHYRTANGSERDQDLAFALP